MLFSVLHMLFSLCKFHVGNFFCPTQSWEGSFLQDQTLKVILVLVCLWVFAVYIPGTNLWWRGRPGALSWPLILIYWPFWLQCVTAACLRIVLLCERLEDLKPGLSICISWLEAKWLLASKCVENLFLLFCQCKVLGKDFYLEYPFHSN